MDNQLKAEWLAALKIWLSEFDASSFPDGWSIDVAQSSASIRLNVPEGSCRQAFFSSGIDQTPREAINAVFGKWREAIEDWERDGRRQAEIREWLTSKQHLIGRISVNPSFEVVQLDGRSRQRIFGIEIRTLFVPDANIVKWLSCYLIGAGATSVKATRTTVTGLFLVSGISLVDDALDGGLLELFERVSCDACDGTGYCTHCHGDGCHYCDGDPECGECCHGQVYLWKDMPFSAYAVSFAQALHITGEED